MSLALFDKGMITCNLTYLETRPAFVDKTVRRGSCDRLAGIVGPL